MLYNLLFWRNKINQAFLQPSRVAQVLACGCLYLDLEGHHYWLVV